MKSAGIKMICRMLIASLMLFQFPVASAGMVSTDQVVTVASAQADREALLSALSRPEVASQLVSMGVDPKMAQERVAALTNDEVRTLTGNLDSLPAGARSNNGWGIALLIIIGLVVYFNWK